MKINQYRTSKILIKKLLDMISEFKKELAKLLTDCITQSIYGTDFRWEIFFNLWFRQHGSSLFFLFKKNLSVTNTQYVELFSLLSQHSRKKSSKNGKTKLLFYSTEHIKTTFTEVVSSLLEDYNPNDSSKISNFSKRYLDIFCSSVAVDMFFGSCAIFLPSGIEIDLEKITFDSGYIHSSGKSIFIRNIKKAKRNDFLESIKNHLNNNLYKEPVPFIVYSHEDFSKFDTESEELIEKGLELSKIYLDKMSMGSYRLSTIINEMQKSPDFESRLLIPDAGNYLKQHEFRKRNTIWLISDKSISGGIIRNPGANRYYICYEQLFKNDSPFFYFDENKPAWKSHTTLPHTLTAALINIARPFIDNGVICDPFSGTGTTWFEVKRIQLKNKIITSDLSPATRLLLSDNLSFFTLSSNELVKLKNDLKACYDRKILEGQYRMSFSDISPSKDPYIYAIELLNLLKSEQKDEDQEFILSVSFVKELINLPFITRIIFYLWLRSELRYQSGFKRKSITLESAFKESLNKLVEQIDMLIELKKDVEQEIKINGAFLCDSYIKSLSRYSYRLTPILIFKNKKDFIKNLKSEVTSSFDAKNLKANSIDFIICDPPYGFNTTEDNEDLANLYSDFIDKAILSLRPKGQLIICLPAESFTGRDLPYCTRSDLVSRLVIIKAHQHGRLVFRPAQSIPINSLVPPYYWESERALRRTILHFCFL